MVKTLISWLGRTDLQARTQSDCVGRGPIAQAIGSRGYARLVLLCDYPPAEVEPYMAWLQNLHPIETLPHFVTLTSPVHFGEIYKHASHVVAEVVKERGGIEDLAFHLSPGTPAMAAVWIILAKTRFPAELIESSREHGVHTASVPFDISADFIPDLLRKPDEELERLTAGLPPEAPEFANIIHRSPEMKRVVARARRVAPRSIPVLIEGESGTGKELLARAIHRASIRREKAFVAVNCGAISPELVESELFGHEKGAFTGALSARTGYFEAAQGGTLFLDEVGELPLAAQVKFLRALQEGEIVRVGATTPIKVDVRIIAATNRTLTQEVFLGRFREDLFYRLAVIVLLLPPLRDRSGDIAPLVDHLLEQINRESGTEPGFEHKKLSVGARDLLLRHRWLGNVRELQNTLRRAVVWSTGPTIRVEDVRDSLFPAPRGSLGDENILGFDVSQGIDLPDIIDRISRHYLGLAIEKTAGNKTRAAELLGLASYQTLTNWMKRYGVKV
ncbi:MAG: sigma-54-dependent Fis family transcriptional regulator [Magnetococcales bacterium]|nr:sigma-54-dependent Fis family transcriptional regulator [Magnetococcales bacterium]